METCCLSGKLCSRAADSCDTTQRQESWNCCSAQRPHFTEQIRSGDQLAVIVLQINWKHLAGTPIRPSPRITSASPWTCWTSSRITSQATPAVLSQTRFIAQEISYQVSCREILSPGEMIKYPGEKFHIWHVSGISRWLPTSQAQDLDFCGRWNFRQYCPKSVSRCTVLWKNQPNRPLPCLFLNVPCLTGWTNNKSSCDNN